MNQWQAVWTLLRPIQWIKNGFVLVGILFSQQFSDFPLLLQVLLATAAFCLASSCVYVFNDIVDCPNDLHHPKKKYRPLPSGQVTIPCAAIVASLLGIIAIIIGMSASISVTTIIISYLALNVAYTLWLKHIVILDVFCIAAGFMLRILAGTIGVGIPPSKWLLLCSLMITLFLGFAKRRAEITALDDRKVDHRQVLRIYSAGLLDQFIAICATGVIICYSLYTMSPETIAIHNTENLIYTVPFVIYALFRYIFLLHSTDEGGDPTRDLLKDRQINFSVLGWAGMSLYFL